MNSRSADSSVAATAALLTPPGRGAVATIRICGPKDQAGPIVDRYFRAANRHSLSDQDIGRICFGQWHDGRGSDESTLQEDVVACRTSEDVTELHCHGGDAAVKRILGHLAASGIDTVTWQLQRATLTSPFEVECREVLSRATTIRTAGILLEQSGGLLEQEFRELLDLTTRADEAAVKDDLQRRLDALTRRGRFGLHLASPWRVVLAGRPNVGKSTLLNALLGYSRAIVYDQPGTTRDVVTGDTAFDGWPLQFADTAGIRSSASDELEQQGIERSHRAIADADLVCLLFDGSEPATPDDQTILTEAHSKSRGDRDWLVVLNKSDLPRVWTPQLDVAPIEVSSLSGDGIDRLLQRIVSKLIPDVPPPATPVPVTGRQFRWIVLASCALTSGDITGLQDALQSCLDGME